MMLLLKVWNVLVSDSILDILNLPSLFLDMLERVSNSMLLKELKRAPLLDLSICCFLVPYAHTLLCSTFYFPVMKTGLLSEKSGICFLFLF